MIVAGTGLICKERLEIGLLIREWLDQAIFVLICGFQQDPKRLVLSAQSSGKLIGEVARLRKPELSAKCIVYTKGQQEKKFF